MRSALFDLSGKIAIVTGSGKGIGKALALGLAEAGAKVVVSARTSADIEATAEDIRALGGESLPVPTDVRNSEQVEVMLQKTLEKFSRVDILVNNAGGSFNVPPLDMSENAWDSIIRENLKSVFLCSSAVGKTMKEQKSGSIINISSIAAIKSYLPNAAYGAAKAGIVNLTKTMAVDMAPYGVRVNAIAPGYIETPGIAALLEQAPDVRQQMQNQIPAQRLGKPDDITGAVVFLASDASDYVVGDTIIIDGGLVCA